MRDNAKKAPVKGMALWALCWLLLIFLCTWPSTAEVTNEDCLGCHSDKELEAETERGKKLNLFVPNDALNKSVHEGLNCTDCHIGDDAAFEEVPHGSKGKPVKVECGSCHEEIQAGFLKDDIHGRSYTKNNPRAPYCSHCHGGHDVLPLSSPDSRMSRKKQADNCGQCHGKEELNLQQGITKRNLITRFKASVHFQAITEGKNGANCTDCHSHHNILSSAASASTVGRTGVMEVCRNCHPNQVKTYANGPHGLTLKHGNNDVPTCITCHGDHDMASLRMRVGDAKQWASTQVCIWCHNNKRMMARYGLDTIPVESYMKDFHGLTQRGTMGASATCSDCHDPHHSLPTDHPASRMYISNRGTTCGKCHGKVEENFAQSFTHRKAMEKPGTRIENIVRIVYILLILVSVAGMFGYNFLIWLWAVRVKFRKQRKQKHINRMMLSERVIHTILLTSFFTLAITGFALKFPETFWAKWLFSLGMTEAIRAFIHRTAAMAMTLDLVFLGFYMIFKKRGRGILYELLPRKRDITDFWKSVTFYLKGARGQHPPHYSVFNFAEKFEFWALLWGTVVMMVSGVILWLPRALPESWPSWVIAVARVVHFYEALLATLAIIIWHLFQTMFHPAEYPMNTSWITGYITEEEAKHRFEDEAIDKMRRSATLDDEEEDNT